MNVYQRLNKMTEYIDEHLEEKIEYDALAKMLGVNTYTLQRVWRMLTGVTLGDYIRKRRLSAAGADLADSKAGVRPRVVDVAIKYGYDGATSFSRAFEKFHGVKPGSVGPETRLLNFPRIKFNEEAPKARELDYEIVELGEFTLYGTGVSCDNTTIRELAPELCAKLNKKHGLVDYGMTTYDADRQDVQKYFALYIQPLSPDFEKIVIPSSRWLKFRVSSRKAQEIQNTIQRFYREFLPSARFNLREIPELEHYHDGKTDILVPIC